MPAEYDQLKNRRAPISACPFCDARPLVPFLRGLIQRKRRAWWFMKPEPYCAVICSECKEIVMWEAP
jgi:hypothetical protein